MSGSLSSFYSERISRFSEQVSKLSSWLRILALLRVAAFVSLLTFFYLQIFRQVKFTWVPGILCLVLFIVLVWWSRKKSKKRELFQALVKLNNLELLAIDHRFDQFDDGRQFIDPDHFNSYDLDLYGKGSLFQFLNRTTTVRGAEQLASWLNHPELSSQALNNRQQWFAELAGMTDWRQHYSVYGQLGSESETTLSESEFQKPFRTKLIAGRRLPFVMGGLILFSLIGLGYWIWSGLSGWFMMATVLQVLFWLFQAKAIKEVSIRMGRQLQVLDSLKSRFDLLEKTNWQSAEGQRLIQELTKNGAPSVQISRLSRLVSAFDNRNNILVGLVLNLVFCWDIWCCFLFHRWFKNNQSNFGHWFDILALFDAAGSLAVFSFNHPEYSFPETVSGDFYFEAVDLGHPLIRPEKRVGNDFIVSGEQRTILVTGANMSGKSTFLRTIGVNMVLAMAGAPVCARSMRFTPCLVFSNMRTTDSLFDDESYFFAELKRLKQLLEEIQNGRKLFVLLDEILKGTNSVDKLNGSIKLVEKLIRLKTPVIVATHDLKLTELETVFPQQLRNHCFEIGLADDEMQFDYRLRPGVTHVMNASFLMKKMGIIED